VEEVGNESKETKTTRKDDKLILLSQLLEEFLLVFLRLLAEVLTALGSK
jgi:hypothetical protein